MVNAVERDEPFKIIAKFLAQDSDFGERFVDVDDWQLL